MASQSDQFKKKFAKKMTKKEKKLMKLKSDITIWCRHENVAYFYPDDLPRKGHHCTCIKEYGTLLKKSAYCQNCYVIALDKGFNATVHFDHTHFASGTSNTNRFD